MSNSVRLLIWFVGLLVVAAISALMFEVVVPPITTSVAIDQFQDSEAAYQTLRTSELMKNGFATVVALIAVIWSVVMWWKPAGAVYKIWKEEAGL